MNKRIGSVQTKIGGISNSRTALSSAVRHKRRSDCITVKLKHYQTIIQKLTNAQKPEYTSPSQNRHFASICLQCFAETNDLRIRQ